MSEGAALRRREQALVEGEFHFTRRNFERIAALLYEQSGIHVTDAKAALVYSRLAKRVRKLGLGDFDAYCAMLERADADGERREMMAALTTNLTRFFREPHHFEHLKKQILPRLAAAAKAGARVRLWSSACSSGEEPYSIALTLLDVLPDAARYDIKLLATDIDPNMVTRARAGLYKEEAVEPIPPHLRQRWLERAGGDWSVRSEVRALITFNELNLIGDWPMRGRFDVIFCRNVAIYFDDATQARLWTRFRNALAPEGRLYIGHSERIDVPGYVSDGLTIYRCGREGRS